jgi:hypothetical protein
LTEREKSVMVCCCGVEKTAGVRVCSSLGSLLEARVVSLTTLSRPALLGMVRVVVRA